MLKRNNRYIPQLKNGSTPILKAYRGATLVFGNDDKREPCFAVVDDISTYTDRTWNDVYDQKDKKWYKLNNLNEYEEYGVMNVYGRLPDGYSEVEYVYNDANNQGWNIDLGFKPNENHKYQIKMQPTELGGNAIAGDGETNDNDDYRFFFHADGFGLSMDYGSGRVSKTGLNKDYILGKIWELEFGNFYIKDLQTNTNLASSTRISGSRSRNLQLFLRFSNSSTVDTQDYENIYYFKVYEGDNLIMDLVPCINLNNIPGFYDLITKQFYTTSNGVLGHGTVLNDLENISHYTGKLIIYHGHQYKWNGTEWVDMGEYNQRLPYGYNELDGISANGDYFITDYYGNQNSKYVFGFLMPGKSNDFGTVMSVGRTNYQYGMSFSINDKGEYIGYNCNGNTNDFWYQPEFNTVYNVEYSRENIKLYNSDNSTVLKTTSLSTNWNGNSNIPLSIFASKEQSSVINEFNGTLYYFKVYDGTNLVRDYVPCSYNGNVGLYDLINNKFIQSEKSQFTAGNIINIPVVYDQKVEPADNVEYDTLEELELMECPWYGMKAIVGGKKYEYTKDGWSEMKKYIQFNLNGQWVESTKKLDGYDVFESNSNYHVNNGYASMQVKWFGYPDFKLYINSYGEASYDYTIAWQMDKDSIPSNPSYSSSGVVEHTVGNNQNPTSIDNYVLVSYTNDGGEHFAWITYCKDGSVNYYDDRGRVAVQKDIF